MVTPVPNFDIYLNPESALSRWQTLSGGKIHATAFTFIVFIIFIILIQQIHNVKGKKQNMTINFYVYLCISSYVYAARVRNILHYGISYDRMYKVNN